MGNSSAYALDARLALHRHYGDPLDFNQIQELIDNADHLINVEFYSWLASANEPVLNADGTYSLALKYPINGKRSQKIVMYPMTGRDKRVMGQLAVSKAKDVKNITEDDGMAVSLGTMNRLLKITEDSFDLISVPDYYMLLQVMSFLVDTSSTSVATNST